MKLLQKLLLITALLIASAPTISEARCKGGRCGGYYYGPRFNVGFGVGPMGVGPYYAPYAPYGVYGPYGPYVYAPAPAPYFSFGFGI